MTVARQVLFSAIGVGLILAALRSAVGVVVVPRGLPSQLSRLVFLTVRVTFRAFLVLRGRGRRRAGVATRDPLLVFYAPVSLLALQACWLMMVGAGYIFLFDALGGSWREAVRLSGSSLTTLGFDRPQSMLGEVLAFTEAGAGLALLTLLITYLPSLYSAFGRREQLVRKLEVRAGTPPSGCELLERAYASHRQHGMPELWRAWEDWFVDVEESHTSFAALAFFRSPSASLSWITAAGAVLDAAALLLAAVPEAPSSEGAKDLPPDEDVAAGLAQADPLAAEVCLRSGALALRRIATYYSATVGGPTQPGCTSVREEEFDEVFRRLTSSHVPVSADRAAMWTAFQSWRAHYDLPLVRLAALIEAPPAPWSSDRELPVSATRLRLRSRHVSGDASEIQAPNSDRPAA
ncbi:MAG: hypothetical protein QOC98_1234 [Frankiaceae bacterium]|nr:hypothetical protein [Frankiaceae bacterium]